MTPDVADWGVRDVARYCRKSLRTVARWLTAGVTRPGSGRRRVRLEAVRVGGTWRTNKAAVDAFLDRLTPATEAPAIRTPAQRRAAHDRATTILRAKGYKL